MNTSVFMGLVRVVPAFLASGFHHLLHVSPHERCHVFHLHPSVGHAHLEYQLAALKWAANPLHVGVGVSPSGWMQCGVSPSLPPQAEIRAGGSVFLGAWCCPVDVN